MGGSRDKQPAIIGTKIERTIMRMLRRLRR
jgi:hypothetical protein